MAIFRTDKLGSFTIYSKDASSKSVSKTFSNVLSNAQDEDVYAVAMAIANVRKYVSNHDIARTEKCDIVSVI